MEIVIWTLAGCMLGIITGLLPGIHVNTVAAVATGLAAGKSTNIAAMVAAMAAAHSIVDFVPSILIGMPDSENFLAMLPGHRMLAKGKGLKAVKLAALGGMAAGMLSLLLAPFFFLFLSKTIVLLEKGIAPALIMLAALMIAREKRKKWAIVVMALSGILGIIVLEGGTGINEPLFPLITGFFGITTALQGMSALSSWKEQEKKKHSFSIRATIDAAIMGATSGMIVAVLPSIGTTQAALISKKIFGKTNTEKYLMLLGGISTANTIFALFALFAISKTRSGTAAALDRLLEQTPNEILFISLAVLAGIGIGTLAAITCAEKLVQALEKMDYRKTNKAVIGVLVLLTLLISGPLGLIVLATAACISTIAGRKGVSRTNCMAFLILPTLLFYSANYTIF